MYQGPPLSATIMPYLFSARQMTRTSSGSPEMSTPPLSRTRSPIGGRSRSVASLAKCVAG